MMTLLIKRVSSIIFNFKNTYSYSLIKKKSKKSVILKVSFKDDKYDGNKINKEFTSKEKKNTPVLRAQ